MEQIEIEYKILITEDIFYQILSDYHEQIKHDYIQINDYFTHPLLQQKKYMLRIRTKNNQYEMTLKRPLHNHRLETNIILTPQQKEDFYNMRSLHNEITDILRQENIPIQELQQQFSLTTHRYDIPLLEGMLSLDMNTYLNQVDYELEFEVFNEQEGYQKFLDIIKPYQLHYTTNCDSKIKRVLDAI
ncbi:CYTH domain-containing protein [Candidatus Stoquefichus massiliensis]|uniref:CYTH domain-containing protein n=1 Tax=Candidatus Stoquefichus massiliensis TaxID=1470350 RepID=UPI0004B2CA2B|nr:CYTH domain-containing protein [Candidatus Stoquefichus massiliensis]